ncbi:ectonucleoside triphosphate diphosphohydrolase 8-like [Hydractinia symbiolongicarpus]|uniref:ectonucleoside triphosphate diphosphohydrolase 8-like n=1 Tax=Hydractinia symbiolongicarpus TaxID=13093 RepID=UPI00254FD595|nr:ectonucleoside triphosphate diphosphohydrolase 8-like [Hydractinia symbiolongicarpus]
MESDPPVPVEKPAGCKCSKRLTIGIVALLLLLIGIAGVTVTCFVLEQKVLQYRHHYGVIFDAGSSHTDVTVYRWPSQYKDHGTAHTEQITFEKCADSGISSFEKDPDKAGDMIRKCIEKIVLKSMPHKDVKKTGIYVGATAGMRLLCERSRSTCDKIMESIRHALNSFKFRQTKNRVRVLDGKEEASFGWITANLLNSSLSNKVPAKNNTKLIGALDMGGASMEVAFVPDNASSIPENYTSDFILYGVNYTLYTHSYLCYGLKEAQRKVLADLVERSNYTKNISNPCWLNGYNESVTPAALWLAPCSIKPKSVIFPMSNKTKFTFIGSGSPKECTDVVQRLFNKTDCQYSNCTFDGVYQPPIEGHNFMAYSGFGHIGTFLNVSEGEPILDLRDRGEAFCRKGWQEVVNQTGGKVEKKFLRSYCFNALYSYELLTTGLHFKPDSDRVHIARNINGTEVSWSLGFMVNATNAIPTEAPTYRLSAQEFISILTVCSVITLVGLAMLTLCLLKKRLEKNTKYKYKLVN